MGERKGEGVLMEGEGEGGGLKGGGVEVLVEGRGEVPVEGEGEGKLQGPSKRV